MELITIVALVLLVIFWPGYDDALKSLNLGILYGAIPALVLSLIYGVNYFAMLVICAGLIVAYQWVQMAKHPEAPQEPRRIGTDLPQQRPAWVDDIRFNPDLGIGD